MGTEEHPKGSLYMEQSDAIYLPHNNYYIVVAQFMYV